jgi:hypothetical protein
LCWAVWGEQVQIRRISYKYLWPDQFHQNT